MDFITQNNSVWRERTIVIFGGKIYKLPFAPFKSEIHYSGTIHQGIYPGNIQSYDCKNKIYLFRILDQVNCRANEYFVAYEVLSEKNLFGMRVLRIPN
ncbi:hypothetical protein Glove_309g26 [Diversispora epigaea]|uniref:Uncharacterized protein n=1 Tax=Diversispora epigaea TaxID=1348612 RepID=A0A397HZL9_9GLOM|nr:hypothetical protein Glove_309g26 [Diversispora epigaea]